MLGVHHAAGKSVQQHFQMEARTSKRSFPGFFFIDLRGKTITKGSASHTAPGNSARLTLSRGFPAAPAPSGAPPHNQLHTAHARRGRAAERRGHARRGVERRRRGARAPSA